MQLRRVHSLFMFGLFLMAAHDYDRFVRWCDVCDREGMVDVERIRYASDSTAELWVCPCGEHHRNEFQEGEDA